MIARNPNEDIEPRLSHLYEVVACLEEQVMIAKKQRDLLQVEIGEIYNILSEIMDNLPKND